MKTILKILALAGLSVASVQALAALNIFACEPEWGTLAKELGGDRVGVFTATTALQDAHRVEARPSLIARARNADLLLCTGSELEIGWVPLLLTQAGNSRIQAGAPGYLEASQQVARIEIPQRVDRSQGDVHPGGNPHIQTDARNIARVAEALAQRLAQLDPQNAADYKSRSQAFGARWQQAIQRWERAGARLKDMPVVVFHKDFSYLIRWMGMREAGSLEPRPGIPPTPAQLAALVEQMKRAPAKAILYAPYNDPRAAQFLSERTGIPAVMLPFTVGGSAKAGDLFGLFDETISLLLEASK